ncbi:hypothetical protein E4P29_22790 [Rhodococcus sp. 1R11]|nr:hypothetical protein E4P29_22790 [Rhodococcus sp. 1R11]
MNRSQRSTPPFWDLVNSLAAPHTGILPAGDRWSEDCCFRIYPGLPSVRTAVAEAATAPGQPATHTVLVQGRRARTVAELTRSWGDALEFPSYYGQNMDAFDECFRDLLDIEEGGLGSRFGFGRPGRDVSRVVLTVMDADQLLTDDSLFGLAGLMGHLQRLYDEVRENGRASADLRLVLHPNHSDNVLSTLHRFT